jgi:phosphonatase-like hydrolase
MPLSDHISLAVFDMAGTTFVDRGEIEDCFLEACQRSGLDVTGPEINAMMGWSKIAVFQAFWEQRLGSGHPELEARVNASYDLFRDILEDFYRKTELQPTEGAVETINWLRSNGVKVVLNTGFYRVVTDIILAKLGWDKGLDAEHVVTGESFIDMSITSDEVEKGRPHPYMIQKAMRQFGISDPKRVVKVGDTPVDLGEGRSAGCLLSLAVTNGSHTEAELAPCDNDGLLPTFGHLKHFLQEKFALENV